MPAPTTTATSAAPWSRPPAASSRPRARRRFRCGPWRGRRASARPRRYHHFKDKGELLDAVAHEDQAALDVALTEARTKAADSKERMTSLGVAYVCFARDNPALYRVMYDGSRDKDAAARAR